MNPSWDTFYARSLAHLNSSTRTPTDTHTHTHDSETPETDSASEDESDIDDTSDPGTSWFAEHNAPEKVLGYLTSPTFPLAPCNTTQFNTQHANTKQPTILDLGTGNGSMLALLREKGGFEGDMLGVDYSEGSIQLARELYPPSQPQSRPQNEDGVKQGIRFEVWDIFSGSTSQSQSHTHPQPTFPDWLPSDGFDIVLDKGTFDAISLSSDPAPSASASGQRICEVYPSIAKGLVKRGGYLVVTSCNWTEEELVRWFVPPPHPSSSPGNLTSSADGQDDRKTSVFGRVDYPRFRFGGMEGQGVCTVCFRVE